MELTELTIHHQAIELHWPPPDYFQPRTLVLGSFNPFNSYHLHQNLDYHYGRKTNLFWPSLARILQREKNYFYKRPDRKFGVMKHRFACADVIDSIKIRGTAMDIQSYAINEVYTGFSDASIWKTSTRGKIGSIEISRYYNPGIPKMLKESKTIDAVIHTMGKNTISSAGIFPVERNVEGGIGFAEYMTSIIAICKNRNITFIPDCPAPTGRSAAFHGDLNRYLDLLGLFYRTHLHLL